MSSIIEGYNYDIFISYRQKDNKHDGWVTLFIENLKGELEAQYPFLKFLLNIETYWRSVGRMRGCPFKNENEFVDARRQ